MSPEIGPQVGARAPPEMKSRPTWPLIYCAMRARLLLFMRFQAFYYNCITFLNNFVYCAFSMNFEKLFTQSRNAKFSCNRPNLIVAKDFYNVIFWTLIYFIFSLSFLYITIIEKYIKSLTQTQFLVCGR